MNKIIDEPDFISRHRNSPKDFTRNRRLTFRTMIVFLMNLIRSSIQNELDIFFKTVNGKDVPESIVTDSAFFQARKKLKHEAFIELRQRTNEYFYNTYPCMRWHQFRLVATDGSTAKVPKNPNCRDYFGELVPNRGEPCPLGRVSQCFDVLNHNTIHATISPKIVGERELAAEHLQCLGPGDLMLLDRGYPAFWLFSYILEKQVHFCARVNRNFAPDILSNFLLSDEKETIVSFEPSAATLSKCRKRNLPCSSLTLRVIRVDSKDIEDPVILVTSLLDTRKYPYEIFADLYQQRWPVEEDYKLLKCRIEIENFSGKSVESVKQDFYARIFTCNLTSMLAFPLHNVIDKKCTHRKYSYKINWTQAIAKMRNCGVLLFFRKNVHSIITKLQKLFLENLSEIRPGRHFPRKRRVSNKFWAFPYKPIS